MALLWAKRRQLSSGGQFRQKMVDVWKSRRKRCKNTSSSSQWQTPAFAGSEVSPESASKEKCIVDLSTISASLAYLSLRWTLLKTWISFLQKSTPVNLSRQWNPLGHDVLSQCILLDENQFGLFSLSPDNYRSMADLAFVAVANAPSSLWPILSHILVRMQKINKTGI